MAEDAFAFADDEVVAALRPAVARIGAAFGDVESMTIAEPGELEVWASQRNILQRAEGWQTFRGWIDAVNPRFGFNVARNMAVASTITVEQVALAQVARRRAVERARLLLEGGAVICQPTTPFTAPPIGLPLSELDRYSARIGLLTSFAGLVGLPQINLPLGMAGGKPCGLSLIGWRGADARLAAIAKALEAHA